MSLPCIDHRFLSFNFVRTSRLPVIYVFGKQPVDIQDCASVFDGFFSKDTTQKVILMYDVIYTHCIGKAYCLALQTFTHWTQKFFRLIHLFLLMPDQMN